MNKPTHKRCSYKNCRIGNDVYQPIDPEFTGKRGETKWCRTCRDYFKVPARLARRQAKIVEYGGHEPKSFEPAPNQRHMTDVECLMLIKVLLPDESGGLKIRFAKDRPDLNRKRGEVNLCVV